MPKKKTTQPELIREERADYKITPEDQARKDEYRARLRTFLEDPESRKIEGFPIGEIDDILALSDPPYYTACPNPFLAEIIEQWQKEREQFPSPSLGERLGVRAKYHREPFAADVSEGKNDPIYNAHSYHTKVPHKAIMRYILHYTEPGDVVFDGFCGTGMTGVAAQLCGDKKTVESMGYRVTDDGAIYEGDKLVSQLGARKAVLNDLSPAATFIAYNYNTPVDVAAFEREAKRILEEVEEECGWMYETQHLDNNIKGRVNYTIWSDVYACPECGQEMIFWDTAVDHEENQVLKDWKCNSCGIQVAKTSKGTKAFKVDRVSENVYDEVLGRPISRAKQVPVLINYSVGNKNFEKRPDKFDLALIDQIKKTTTDWFPVTRIDRDIDLWYERDYRQLGVYSVDGFFASRTVNLLSKLLSSIRKTDNVRIRSYLLWAFTAIIEGSSKMNRERLGRMPSKLSGTLYIGALIREINAFEFFRRKVKKFSNLLNRSSSAITSTQSTTQLTENLENSFDYIFTDPPFGSNIIYSDLSILWEAWLNLFTNTNDEAVIHRRKKKNAMNIFDYTEKMAGTFSQMYKVLKPGHWLTVEFHNSQNSVWGSIQEAILRAGFIIADVRTLDKQQSSFKQVTTSAAVKQDLIISAYKPNDNLEERFRLEAGTSDGAWDFVRYHLTQLPRVVEKNDEIEVIAERQDFLLFDRMVAFHIQRGASVPLSAGEFYAGLKQKFVERDGMYFLPDQVAEYDAARLRLGKVAQLALFVSDEKSAIQWLRQQLTPEMGGELQTFAELQPKFMQIARSIAKHEQMPDLGEILEQNFLEDASGKWYSPDPSKGADLERLRLKSLLREFNEYVQAKGKLKQFRTEAVRAGFAEAYKKREYKVILEVAGRLPESVLHEDPDLLMYFDTATLRMG